MSADDPNKHPFDDIFPTGDEDNQPAPDSEQPAGEPAGQQDELPGPASAAPPRIVSEAPLGGVSRPVTPPRPPENAVNTDPSADADATGPDTDAPASSEAIDAMPQAHSGDTGADTDADTGIDTDTGADTDTDPGADSDTQPAPAIAPPDPAHAATPEERQIAERLKKLLGDDAPPVGAAAGTAASTAAGAGEVARPPVAAGEVAPESAPETPASAPVNSAEAGGMTDPGQWEDDDISPQLAAVLFGGTQSGTEPAPATEQVQPASQDAPAPETTEPTPAETAPEPEPDAAPVMLTDIANVRRLPITAEKRSAPAPETAIEGKARYVRVEEPLRNDEGERTLETWEYIKPDYPALRGRLVKEVTVEEISYSDGSWLWRYERRYTDRGHDSREVRANPDRTYIEREDEVSKLDADSGRRLQFKEEAELIFAAPEKKEKGGLLSGIGGLLGLDGDDNEDTGPKVWRTATSSEARQARKQGGEALKRGFLGL